MPESRSWVLFEDRLAAGGAARLYRERVGVVRCAGPADLQEFFRAIESWHRAGVPVVLVLDYEFGDLLGPVGAPTTPAGPVAFALAYRGFQRGSSRDLERWIGPQDAAGDAAPAGVSDLQVSIGFEQYRERFERVQRYIRDGHTYQINLTFPLHYRWFGDPLSLYRRLRERQRVSYGAYIDLDGRSIVCLSPELFVQRSGDTIRTRPMKGTRPRGADREQDGRIGRQMQDDPKSRAENLMIVDLLRNDLGRVCEIGSVRVDSLFDIETFDTVLQMTSTVRGRVGPQVGLERILRALFPCGSVTGAPKHRSRQIIAEVEAARRGVYTGSIGYLDPDGTLLLNVAIRTMELNDDGTGMLGIGGGIVADSTCADEWSECFLKARFLTEADPGFRLIETMRAQGPVTAAGAAPVCGWIASWSQHAARLQRSAACFGFAFDRERIEAALRGALLPLADGAHRVRALLDKRGVVEVSSQPLPESPAGAPIARVGLAGDIVRSDAWHQAHKTTHRPLYEAALRQAQARGLWDLLFLNERGELVEGARSSVFLDLDGTLATPPLSSGALPGIERARVLADASRRAVERVVTRADLERARSVYLCNAVRGLFAVRIV
jgi:para-aminobenzoate synthetase / 4-amino-4-deoxychorismate lyase